MQQSFIVKSRGLQAFSTKADLDNRGLCMCVVTFILGPCLILWAPFWFVALSCLNLLPPLVTAKKFLKSLT